MKHHVWDRREFLHASLSGLGACAAIANSNGASGNTPTDTGTTATQQPQPLVLPSWIPAEAGVAQIVTTRNSFLSQNGNLAGWEHSFGKIVDDYSGGVFNPYWGVLGAMVFHGGGHSATFDNSVVILDLNDLTFKRVSNPTPSNHGKNWLAATPTNQVADPAFNALHGEYADGQPGSAHTYDTLAILPPADGGAPCGSLIRVASFAVHVNVSANTGWAHRMDFVSTSARGCTWQRYSVNGPTSYLFPGMCSAYDSNRKRMWWISGLSSNPPFIRYLDVATRRQLDIRFVQPFRLAPVADPDSVTLRFEPIRDILVLTCTVQRKMVLAFLRCGQPEAGWTVPTLSQAVTARSGSSHGFDWVPAAGHFVLTTSADDTALYAVTPSATLASPWSVVRRPLAGGPIPSAYVVGKRWSYVPILQSFIWMASSTAPVIAYRPSLI